MTLNSTDGQSAGYFNLTSQRMILDGGVEERTLWAFADHGAQPVFTYLANYITAGEDDKAKIPYSTVTAIDFAREPPLGPFVDLEGQPVKPLAEGEIALNRWAVEDMAAQGVETPAGGRRGAHLLRAGEQRTARPASGRSRSSSARPST